ncbi:MAG: Lrp/AsnC family transcriptional regulator [Deltaproteobacteria bacterium]|nr:Lrp/AsnC family transcriptional regulator [Deltaproteobacteria bacterium]
MPQQGVRKSPETSALSPQEADIARLIQGDIPLTGRPFQRIAETAGLTEGEVLSLARSLRKRGIIRKIGAIVRHQKVGYTHNVMVLWAVPPAGAEAAGKALSSFAEVTHNYERTPPFAGRFNLFTMIHFRKKTDEDLLRKMALAAGVTDFRILRSLEEFKKNSMEYF